jgi:aryl-phospho-beta-D-glucosidase BglC (GH1 family)
LSFPLLGLLALAHPACSGQPDDASAEVVSAVAVSGGGVTVDVLATNSWPTGFNGAVRITDTAFPAPITSFEIVFGLGGTATIAGSAWNGNISAPDGAGNRTATQPDWLVHQPIMVGQTWEVGFPGNNPFASSTITSVKINGQAIAIGGGNGGDAVAPAVSVASSVATVTAAGSITLTATASDNVGVTRVEFSEGATLLGTDAAAPYTQTVAFTAANNGTHSYTARAFDAAGNNTTSTAVTVTVNIPVGGGDVTLPTVSLASSAVAVTTATSITLTATASDNVGVTRVEFLEGTTLLGTDTTAPYTQVVALTAANNGTHSYTARAFDAAGNNRTSAAVTITVNIPALGAVFRVDPVGNITKNGQRFPVHCGNWFGLEGRHEPSNDATNPSGAPMELYMGNTFWANGGAGTGRTIQQTMTEIVAAGINVVRFPVVPQTLRANDPQGMPPNLKNHPSVRGTNARQSLEQFITLAKQNNIEVILDMHSCSNYVGWRKGRLDARPPWVDKDRDNYDFKRENFSCAATGNPASVTTVHAYNETLWLNDLKTLAGLGTQLGVDNIIGIDLYNEPWDYTWADWKTLTEHAFTAINSVNPNTLVFVEGVSSSANNQDGTPATITQVPFGNAATNPNWGENLFDAGANPPNMPKDRLVFSPHTYGPSVAVQRQFMDPAQPQCAGLEGDAAGNARCNIVINPTLLRAGWQEHFGYLKAMGFAVVVGEFGGNLDWPRGKTSLRDQARWAHVTTPVDAQWQDAFVSYAVEKNLEGCYWSINPESGDTGGWYGHAYDPISNTAGWGEWQPFDARKTALLNRFWAPR